MFQKALMFFFAAKVALVTCHYEANHSGLTRERLAIQRIGKLPALVNECSGISFSPWSEHLLAINDSGGEAALYEITATGALIGTHAIANVRNRDWEEMTTDNQGNVYIGDFGNNGHQRKDLLIYKVNPKSKEVSTLTFRYADQTHTQADRREYDCEAFFWHGDSLYLFTKSWEPGIKTTRLYAMPDKSGDYTLQPRAEVQLKAQVTGAAISPDKKRYALLSYGKLFLFGIENEQINFQSPLACIKIARKQTEAVLFESDSSLLVTNEQRGIFRVNLE